MKYVIAVLGGTGNEGRGLAFRWAHAGHTVVLGTRNPEKGQAVSQDLNRLLGMSSVTSLDNLSAARKADVIVLTVPYAAQLKTADEVKDALIGKIVIDVTVPLVPPKVSHVHLPEGDSAVLELQKHLGHAVKVVAAFQNVSAHHLLDLSHDIDCDVLVCGDAPDAVDCAIALAKDAGMNGLAAGPLVNAVVAEGLTSVLISINKRYKIPAAGIRITGWPL